MGNVNMEASQINYRGGEKKMSVEEALKNTSGEAAAIAQLQTDVLNLNSNKANQITIAPFFSAEASYDPGDLVYYNGLSYRCVNAHEGEWDADDFAATTVANELDSLKSGLIGVAAKVPIRGSFTALCSIGNNVFSRNTMDLVAGSIPQSPFNNCIMMIVNHGSNNATNDTIQVDGANEIIINAQIEQNITVAWLDISNIPIVDS